MVDIPEPRKFKLDTQKFSAETQEAYDAVVKDIQAALYDENFDLSKIQESVQAMNASVKIDYVNSELNKKDPYAVSADTIAEVVTEGKVGWAKQVLKEKAQSDGAPGVGKI